MQLDPVMERFYQSILEYAGLELRDNIIVNTDEKLGDFTIDDKEISLPYFELLKNPNGKSFFHLLNENYSSPETSMFTLYRNRLVFEVNLRLGTLITALIALASDPLLQQRVKSAELLEVLTNIGEMDMTIVESFLSMIKASTKVNKESYIVDVFLKKNGKINDEPYGAIGKINFRLFEEVKKAYESADKDYRVFGAKVRKKDIVAIYSIFTSLFPGIELPETYVVGTDNKVFRYLDILLRTCSLVTNRVTDISNYISMEVNEPSLNVETATSNHSWSKDIDTLTGMSATIRLIPDQTDINAEANHHAAQAAEAKKKEQAVQPITGFNPSMIQTTQLQPPQPAQQAQPVTQQPVQQQTAQQPQAPRQLTPEEIIRGGGVPAVGMNMMGGVNPALLQQQMMQQQLMQQQMMQPNMGVAMPMQQPHAVPSWMQQEMINNQLQQNPNQQQQFIQQQLQQQMLQQQQQQMLQAQQAAQQQQMMQQQLMQQQMMQPGMVPQMMQQPFMNNQMPQQQGIPLNPLFMGRSGLAG